MPLADNHLRGKAGGCNFLQPFATKSRQQGGAPLLGTPLPSTYHLFSDLEVFSFQEAKGTVGESVGDVGRLGLRLGNGTLAQLATYIAMNVLCAGMFASCKKKFAEPGLRFTTCRLFATLPRRTLLSFCKRGQAPG